MILINLIGEESELKAKAAGLPENQPTRLGNPGDFGNPHALPFVAALIGLFFSGALFPHLTTTRSEPRPLFVDERETVVAAFSALPSRMPELSGWIEEVKANYVDGAVEAELSDEPSDRLLTVDGEKLQFSREFFDSDPAEQEGALLEAVLAIQEEQYDADEIARQ